MSWSYGSKDLKELLDGANKGIVAKHQLHYDLFCLAKQGYNVDQLSEHFKLSRSRIKSIIIDQEIDDFKRRYNGGNKCHICGKKVVILFHGENPILSICKSGHNVKVVYNREKKCFLVR